MPFIVFKKIIINVYLSIGLLPFIGLFRTIYYI